MKEKLWWSAKIFVLDAHHAVQNVLIVMLCHEGKTDCTYIFPHLRQRLLGHLFFFRQRKRKVFSKTSHFHAYKALAPASPFFLLKATKCPIKKMPDLDDHCHIFYEWPLGMWYFIKNWACDHFIGNLHHQWWRPNPWFHCRQKLLAILPYSKSFKWIREAIRTQGRCINLIKIFEKIL